LEEKWSPRNKVCAISVLLCRSTVSGIVIKIMVVVWNMICQLGADVMD